MPNLPGWLDICVRSIAFLVALFLLTKWLGKKQIAQLSFFEYITGITIGSIAAEVSTGLESNFVHGFISLIVWTVIPFLISYISVKNKRLRNFIEGKATVFIKDGKVLEDNLKRERYTVDELLEQLRKKDVYKLADVEFAVLEPTGDLNVLLKREKQPLTPKDLLLKVAPEKETQTIIMDGKLLDEPLANSGFNRAWLQKELDKLGVSLENVFIGQVDSYGGLTVDLYDDKLSVPSPQEKPMLLANIKKCQADLESFALQTESKEAQAMYIKNAKRLEEIIDKAKHLLQG
ncbi:DUF421 domain-containing protein [Fictibacillus sp. Mic-4]|uniref:DUF421 domain-containing protein n=1 Tax=Fictibacillus TaxID=1329200 RepID=UPI00047A1115|nr:DUF421 domain-containing protein [Fictibacillus gelatini]